MRKWIFRAGLVLTSAIWLAMVAVSWAEGAERGSEAGSSDEYSFNWLDPDKKIYVLQNRRYRKANRLFVSGMLGLGLSSTYRNTMQVDPRAAYYFSEMFGIEVFYSLVSNSENSTFNALKRATSNVIPVVREIRSQTGALLHYVPWYAKINVFNQILYFDWYFSGGAGTIRAARDDRTNATQSPRYTYEDLLAFYAGTGHQYHLSQTFVVRLDFTGAFYRAPLFGNTGESTWFSNYTFGLGLGLRI